MEIKEQIRKYVNENKTGVIIASIFGSGFVSGMIFHRMIGPKYVPVSESITLLTEDVNDETLEILNMAFESLLKQGFKVCKHI